MKKITLLFLSLLVTLTFTSCTVDIPVHPGGHVGVAGHVGVGGGPIMHHPGGHYYGHPGGVVQVGDPRQRRYGNGPQSYIGGFPPPGGYNPHFNYGTGGFR